MAVVREYAQHGQPAAHANLEIVRVMRRGDLHRAGAEFHLHIFIRHDGDLPPHHGDDHRFAHDVRIAFIRRVHGNCCIAQNGFRARCRHGDGIGFVGRIVTHMPKMAVLLLVFHLGIRKGCLTRGAPVDDAVAPVDEPLVVKLHKHLRDSFVAARIHGEAFAFPIARGAELFQLLHDASAVNAFPFPCALQKCFPANVALVDALLRHLLHNLHFRGNGSMIGSGEPKRLVSRHALVTDQHILQRFIKRMPHVELARDVRRRDHDAVRRFAGVGLGMEVPVLLPCFIQPVFHSAVVVCLGHFPVHWVNPPVSVRFIKKEQFAFKGRNARGTTFVGLAHGTAPPHAP